VNPVHYIVAAVGEWNEILFSEFSVHFEGQWSFVSTPDDLLAVVESVIEPKYIFFLHWHWIVPPSFVNNYDCVCFHMTDLPYGRGGSPLQNLIINGHKETKLTALKMDEGLDTGPVYLKETLSLDGKAEDIYQRASKLAWKMIEIIIAEKPVPVPQVGSPTLFQRRTPDQSVIPEDVCIDIIYDTIRMLDAPGYPKAYIDYGKYKLEFSDACVHDGQIRALVSFMQKE